MRPYAADFECEDAPVTCLGVSIETDTGIQVTVSEAEDSFVTGSPHLRLPDQPKVRLRPRITSF